MPPKQPKKGKGKKVTVTDPTSAPANPEVQPVLDAHIANVGSEHFPAGYFPIPYTLTPPDAESFPQLPPLREPLEAALFGKWDQPGNPYLVWRIDATRVNFALTRGVLSRFSCAVMGARVRVKGGKGDSTRKGWGEVIRSDNLDWGLYNKKISVWESLWTKQRGYIENKGVFVQAEQGSQGM